MYYVSTENGILPTPYFFLIFQGTFSVYEKLRQVEEFVSDSLEHALPFVLIDSATGQRLDDDSTKDSTLIGKLIRLLFY